MSTPETVLRSVSNVTLDPSELEKRDVVRVLRPDGSADPERDPRIAPADLRSLYRLMLLNRALDERMITLQRQGRIGFYIGSIGEEACILGSAFVMRPNDWVFPAYREHGAALLRGMPLPRFLANLFGNSEDPIKGRQMPCHEAWAPGNIASISSPLATQLPHAVGVGWAARIKGKPDVAIAYFGDGSTSANDFHAALNFAGVFKAQTIFLCRNNQWAISVPVSKQTASASLAEKASAYGLPGVRVDGNDLLAVVAVTRQAHERARSGQGATLIEAITYRVRGHSTSDDPRAYRTDDQVEPWLKLDPLIRLRAHLFKIGALSEEEHAAWSKEVEEEIREATSKVEKAGPPALETMFEEVYEKLPWHLAEQLEEARRARKGGE
ncbi:MAG TPA: pyruvate dehydrogenase (acetyl-transferring) E1 component subunit alpha [Myxococcales bacterium]